MQAIGAGSIYLDHGIIHVLVVMQVIETAQFKAATQAIEVMKAIVLILIIKTMKIIGTIMSFGLLRTHFLLMSFTPLRPSTVCGHERLE